MRIASFSMTSVPSVAELREVLPPSATEADAGDGYFTEDPAIEMDAGSYLDCWESTRAEGALQERIVAVVHHTEPGEEHELVLIVEPAGTQRATSAGTAVWVFAVMAVSPVAAFALAAWLHARWPDVFPPWVVFFVVAVGMFVIFAMLLAVLFAVGAPFAILAARAEAKLLRTYDDARRAAFIEAGAALARRHGGDGVAIVPPP